MADHDSDRLLAPTPHRRRQAREQGQVAQSQDLGSAVILVGGMIALMYLGGALVQFLARLLAEWLGGEPWLSTNSAAITAKWSQTVAALSTVLLPLLGAILLLSVAASFLQIGWLFLPQRALPDASRISPLTGLQRIFSQGSLVRLVLGAFKIVVVAGVALASLYGHRTDILGLGAVTPNRATFEVARILGSTCLKAGVALVALGVLDYLYQRWRHEQSLKMTPQELREEMRAMQGDSQLASRRRAARRQWTASPSVGDTQQADAAAAALQPRSSQRPRRH